MDHFKRKNKLILPSNLDTFLQPIISLCRVLSSKKFPGVLIGGVASSILGQPRFTKDIDAVILNADGKLTEIIELFEKENIYPRIKNLRSFAKKNRVLLFQHKPSGINIDISMGILPFEIDCVNNRKVKNTKLGLLLLPRPEDLIVLKAIARRPKDIEDIKGIVKNRSSLNKKKILKLVKEFSEMLGMPEIYGDIKVLLKK